MISFDIHKIVIQIREAIAIPQSGEQVWSVLSETLGGFRIELNLAPIGGTVPGPLLERELVKCLLAEMMLRKHKDTILLAKTRLPRIGYFMVLWNC